MLVLNEELLIAQMLTTTCAKLMCVGGVWEQRVV